MMKKLLLLGILLMGISSSIFAAYLKNVPVTVMQPNGTELNCFATGDEYYNWLHDADGFTIMQHPGTGYYVYASLQGDSLVATNYKVGSIDPESIGLRPNLNISFQKMEEKRMRILALRPIDVVKKKHFTKSSGVTTLNNLVVYIRFSDQIEYVEDTVFYWNMFNSLSFADASVLRYFQATSYNKLDVVSHFYPISSTQTIVSYQDINPRSYYLPYSKRNPNGYQNEQEVREREHALLTRAIEAVEDEIPADLNLDYNNDGRVDNICFIVKGNTGGWSDLLWPHRWSLTSNDVYINELQVYDYNFLLSDHLDIYKSSVLCHEMFHTFGSPDLYRYSDNTITPIGAWDLMANNTDPPQSMCAYLKWKHVGWVEEIPEIIHNGRYVLKTVWHENQCIYKIASPNSSTEFFTVEYRNKSDYFDSGIPASGLLIYRINTRRNGNGNGPPDGIYIYRPFANNTLTEGTLGYAAFSLNENRTEFSDETVPSCFLSNNQPGGIHIRNISEIGDSMTFDVIFPEPALPDFTASKTIITPGCSVDFKDESIGYADSWQWTFEGAIPSTSTDQNPTEIVYPSAGSYTVKLLVHNQYGDSLIEKENFIAVVDTVLPTVMLEISDTIACTTDTIQLFGTATPCPVLWHWVFTPNTVSFVDGTTAYSQNPKVMFLSNTSYDVSLSVSNSNGTTDISQANIISVGGILPTGDNEVEDFENVVSLVDLKNKGWKFGEDNNAPTWELFQTNNEQGQIKSIGVHLIDSDIDTKKKSWIITPPYNLVGKKYELMVRYSYCLRSIYSKTDSLNIYASADCGENWTLLGTYGEDTNRNGNFVTHAPKYDSFTPVLASDWCQNNCVLLDLSAYTGKETVKFKFETVRYEGNNLYIDEIMLRKNIGISSPVQEKYLTLYPNPNTGIFTLKSSVQILNGEISVFDVQGKLVYKSIFNNLERDYNLSHLPEGIYFVKINGNNILQWIKFVKQ